MRNEPSNTTHLGESASIADPLRAAAPSRLRRRVHSALVSVAVIVAAAAAVVPLRMVRAASDTVTSCSDSGPGSLRAVIAAAMPGDMIVFSVSCSTIGLSSGEIDIDKNLTISVPGSNAVAISGEGKSRVLGVGLTDPSASVTISGLTIEGGSVRCSSDSCQVGGAGLWNAGTLALTRDVLFRDNSTTCSGSECMVEGGAILNEGTLDVDGDGIAAAGNTALCMADGCSALVGGVHTTTAQ